MPVMGVEPIRCHHQRILSPSRLPIPTHRLICCLYSILQALRKIKIYFVLIFAPPGMQYCLYYTGYNKISGVTILKRFFHMAQLCLCRAGKPQGTVSDPFGLQKMKRTTSILLPIPWCVTGWWCTGRLAGRFDAAPRQPWDPRLWRAGCAAWFRRFVCQAVN